MGEKIIRVLIMLFASHTNACQLAHTKKWYVSVCVYVCVYVCVCVCVWVSARESFEVKNERAISKIHGLLVKR